MSFDWLAEVLIFVHGSTRQWHVHGSAAYADVKDVSDQDWWLCVNAPSLRPGRAAWPTCHESMTREEVVEHDV
jgi:hypothetical protein